MKIGKLILEVGGSSVIIENVEIEDFSEVKELTETLIEEARFAQPRCTYEKVCTDYPKKCEKCTYQPIRSHFYAGDRIVVPSQPQPVRKKDE